MRPWTLILPTFVWLWYARKKAPDFHLKSLSGFSFYAVWMMHGRVVIAFSQAERDKSTKTWQERREAKRLADLEEIRLDEDRVIAEAEAIKAERARQGKAA